MRNGGAFLALIVRCFVFHTTVSAEYHPAGFQVLAAINISGNLELMMEREKKRWLRSGRPG